MANNPTAAVRLIKFTIKLQKYFCNIKIYFTFVPYKNKNTMTNSKFQIGQKAVNISTDATGNVRAMYVQIYNGEQQVLQTKTFSTVKNAEKWANKILN